MKNELLKDLNFDCERCFDTGLWLAPTNDVQICPRIQMRKPHTAPNEAALSFRRAVNFLKVNQIWIHAFPFDLARILARYTTEAPCSRSLIFEYFFGDTNFTDSYKLRKFHGLIEELRHGWLLPVGSRKAEPSGYWIITDYADCAAWLNRSISAPKTQLATLWHCAKHNFPRLAGQQEFGFMNALNAEETSNVL